MIMRLSAIKTVVLPIFVLGLILVCSGCESSMIQSAIQNSGTGYAEAEVPSAKPKALELPLVCFTVSLDATNCPEVRPGAVWLFDLTNVVTLKLTSVQVKPNAPVKWKLFKGQPTEPTHLMVLRLPPGEYLLNRILFQNDENCMGRNPFNPKYIGLDKGKQITFTVKDAQVTYAGRVTMNFTGKRGVLGYVLSSSIDYTVDWSDTAAEDKQWAQKVFPSLTQMPSENLPMQTKPVATPN